MATRRRKTTPAPITFDKRITLTSTSELVSLLVRETARGKYVMTIEGKPITSINQAVPGYSRDISFLSTTYKKDGIYHIARTSDPINVESKVDGRSKTIRITTKGNHWHVEKLPGRGSIEPKVISKSKSMTILFEKVSGKLAPISFNGTIK